MMRILTVMVSGLVIALQIKAQAIQGRIAGGIGRYSNRSTSRVLLDASAGAEVRPARRFGLACGAGLLAGGGDLVGTLSVDGVLHAQPRGHEHGASPFMAAGYSYLGGYNAWHVRGGFDYWRSSPHALTVEVQWTERRDYPTRILSIRVGATFR